MFARFATIGALSEQALGQRQTDLRSSCGGKRAAVLWLQQARTSSDWHASRRMHCGNKPRRRALAALMPSSALVHLSWVVRRLDRADTSQHQARKFACSCLEGPRLSSCSTNQPSDEFRVESVMPGPQHIQVEPVPADPSPLQALRLCRRLTFVFGDEPAVAPSDTGDSDRPPAAGSTGKCGSARRLG